MNTKKIWAGLFAGATLSVLSACLLPVGDGDGLNSQGDVPLPMESLESIQPLLQQNCGTCHGAAASGGMNIGTFDAAFNSFYVVTGSDTALRAAQTTAGAGMTRLHRSIPDSSHLYQRITATTSIRMPPGGGLDQGVVDRIKEWIENGAPVYDTTTTD